jgi:Zn-dependent protease
MDVVTPPNPPEPPRGSLPPEVEAELRRRSGAEGSSQRRESPWAARLKAMGPLGAVLLVLLKYGGIAVKFLIPALKTGGTMLLSIIVYAQASGWPFAVGFVLSILVHEMGHVFAAWRLGMPVSAPLFIPGFGAIILEKREAKSAWEHAVIGIGGPLAGTLAAVVCWMVHMATGDVLYLRLAYVGAFLNLFNMAPLVPLDGGWITGAISPRLWLVGLLIIGGLYLTGRIHNPLLLILLLLSVPRLFHGLRTGDATPVGGIPTTPSQRLRMGLGYLGLTGFLLWLMAHTYRPL